MPRGKKRKGEGRARPLGETLPQRRLRYHEILRIVHGGRVPPGQYSDKVEYVDGTVEIETFRYDEEGRVRDLRIRREGPAKTEPAKLRKKG